MKISEFKFNVYILQNKSLRWYCQAIGEKKDVNIIIEGDTYKYRGNALRSWRKMANVNGIAKFKMMDE